MCPRVPSEVRVCSSRADKSVCPTDSCFFCRAEDPVLSRLEPTNFVVEKTQDLAGGIRPEEDDSSWPCYRHDAWRSGSTLAAGPEDLKTLWSADLGA